MIITRIRLVNWKNFGDVDVNCGKRVFLIGPNASGKSNFLDALRFLRDVAQDGLKNAVETRGGLKAVRFLCARKVSHVGIHLTLEDRDNEWEYGLFFTRKNQDIIVDEEYAYKHEAGKRIKLILRPDAEDSADPMRLTQTALQQVNQNKNFREIYDFLSGMQYRHILPQLVRDPSQFSTMPTKGDPYGRDLVSRIWNTTAKTRNSRLKKINEVLTKAVPQLQNLTVRQNPITGLPHLEATYVHWRPGAGGQNESSFSDGTLRLLALLWSIFDATGPLLLEEPELSLHEEIVRQLPGIFAKLDRKRQKTTRQVFVTTHSAVMLSDPGIGANEILQLEPGKEGTKIRTATETDIKLMEEGLSAAEVFLPKTRPEGVAQLSLLDVI